MNSRGGSRWPRGGGRIGPLAALCAAAALAALLFPALALAHLERPSYWPDPGPDTAVSPSAGGAVPEQRPLGTAVSGRGPGDVRVVCHGARGARSLRAALRSIDHARSSGFRLRPSQPKIRYAPRQAQRMRTINRRLARACEYRSIQAAVDDSHNNDRVVIMPGRYTEPGSRSAPTNDPLCADMVVTTQSGERAPSYEYQVTCPNDQNLVYVQGRTLAGAPPSPPIDDRHGIPNAGECVRCNLQIEGSGPKPSDVIVDAGSGYEQARRPGAEPGSSAKHVVIRADRADGIVLKNMLTRGASEHGFYIEEVDGYLANRVKMFWNAEYGFLGFTSDHGLFKNCDGFGSGDSVIYPGATPETGEQVRRGFYPDGPRINTVVRNCDLRGSTLAYSGSMGNAVRITRNHIYANTAGIATDTVYAAGHPGYPADSSVIDHNLIYSNNLNLYGADPPVEPTVPLPIGTGIIWPGHNNGAVHHNWIFDNWRRGTMLLVVPDQIVEPEGEVNPGISCPTAQPPDDPALSTSCGNRYFANRMGVAPPGFEPPKAITKLGNPHALAGGGPAPNGVDFWWDEFAGNTGNCWRGNTGPDGTRVSLTADPSVAPVPNASLPGFLPENCAASVGLGDVVKEAVLLECSMWQRGETADDQLACDWFTQPPRPGSAAARRGARERARAARHFEGADRAQALRERFKAFGGPVDPAATRFGEPSRAEPLGEQRVGSVAALAQCRDWTAGTIAEREATLVEVRDHLAGGPDVPAPIPDGRAFEVIESACANDFARGFRLYKLYHRAAAFGGPLYE